MNVYAGTSRGLFKLDSSRGGDAQHQQVLACRGVREVVSIRDCLYAGTSTGIYYCDDNVGTWHVGGLEDRAVWQVRTAADHTLYAGTQPAALFSSDDSGRSWQEVETFAGAPEARHWCLPVDPPQPGQARAIVTDAVNPQRIWVGVEVGGIMASADGGESWQLSLPGDNPDIHMMFAHPQQPAVLFVSTGYGRHYGVAEMVEGNAGVFRSTDAGLTWDYVWAGITPRYSRPMCIDSRAPYSLTVASAPHAFSHYKADSGAAAMLFRSDDLGEHWHSLCDPAHSPSVANFHGLTCDPEQPGGVLVGTDNGEVWRVSADANWQQLASGLPTVLSLYADAE